MLSDSDRTRLGQLISRIDLSAEEKQEMDALRRRAYQDAHGPTEGVDFDVSVDDLTVEPLSEAAKRRIPNRAATRDGETLIVLVRQLEGEGFKMRRLAPRRAAS